MPLMERTETRQDRTSFPPTQKTELRQSTFPGQRSSLPTTQKESKRSTITEDDVRLRAYELYLQRAGAPGSDVDDWLQAERELRAN